MPPDGDLATHTLTPEKPRLSRAAKPARPELASRQIPLDVPGFSIELLGRQLALTGYRQRMLWHVATEVGQEEEACAGPKGLTPAKLRQRHVKRAQQSTDDHYYALRDLILSSRPVTPADVVVQLLVCHDYDADAAEGEDATKIRAKIDRVLSGAARCLGEYHHLTLADLGGADCATAGSDEWPDIDISDVVDETDPAWLRAIDGSLPEWQR